MFTWTDEQLAVRDAVRSFVDQEIRPHQDELEHGDLPPYDLIRKFFATFGLDAMAAESFDRSISSDGASSSSGEGMDPALAVLPEIELVKVSMGIPAAIGVSIGLAAGTINANGTVEQRKRWARDLDDLREGRRLGDHRAGRGFRRLRRHAYDGQARR